MPFLSSTVVEALLGYFARRTFDPEEAADLTAETFASALVTKRRFKPGGPCRRGRRRGGARRDGRARPRPARGEPAAAAGEAQASRHVPDRRRAARRGGCRGRARPGGR